MSNTAYIEALRSAASALEHGRYETAIKKLNLAFGGLEHLLDSKTQTLPPMPPTRTGEPLNRDRGAYAMRALQQFANDTEGGELDCALRDLLGDLMHLCHQERLKDGGEPVSFEDELERARDFFKDELFEEAERMAYWNRPNHTAGCYEEHEPGSSPCDIDPDYPQCVVYERGSKVRCGRMATGDIPGIGGVCAYHAQDRVASLGPPTEEDKAKADPANTEFRSDLKASPGAVVGPFDGILDAFKGATTYSLAVKTDQGKGVSESTHKLK